MPATRRSPLGPYLRALLERSDRVMWELLFDRRLTSGCLCQRGRAWNAHAEGFVALAPWWANGLIRRKRR
jgi:hypothetical protein